MSDWEPIEFRAHGAPHIVSWDVFNDMWRLLPEMGAYDIAEYFESAEKAMAAAEEKWRRKIDWYATGWRRGPITAYVWHCKDYAAAPYGWTCDAALANGVTICIEGYCRTYRQARDAALESAGSAALSIAPKLSSICASRKQRSAKKETEHNEKDQ